MDFRDVQMHTPSLSLGVAFSFPHRPQCLPSVPWSPLSELSSKDTPPTVPVHPQTSTELQLTISDTQQQAPTPSMNDLPDELSQSKPNHNLPPPTSSGKPTIVS